MKGITRSTAVVSLLAVPEAMLIAQVARQERVTFEKKGDEWSITVNGFQYYSIPDAVIVGG